MRPLAIDLFCGLGGWTEGLLAEGYDVVGFDLERHHYGGQMYPAQLVLQDVLTIHGSQFRNASLIVASPPCQKYSYLAMPWSRSKPGACGVCCHHEFDKPFCWKCKGSWVVENSEKAKALRKEWETNGPDNRLFDACFRIQREACEAADRYIPMVVENVRGAQPWVGPAKANFGSFYFWGDIGMVGSRIICGGIPFGGSLLAPGRGGKNDGGSWFAIANNTTSGHSKNPVHELMGQKTDGGSWFRERNGVPTPGIKHEDRGLKVPSEDGGRRADPGKGARFTSRDCGVEAGTKIGGDWFSDPNSTCRKHDSRSAARKAASAQIAKIPLPIAQYVAKSYNEVAR